MSTNEHVKFTWTPSEEQRRSANVARLAERLSCADYASLHDLSVQEPERFWSEVVHDLDIRFSEPWERVLDDSDGIEWARWFVGGRLNVARVCVHRWAEERPDEEAAIFRAEDGDRRALTWAELSREVHRLAEGLATLGVGEGDAVGIYLPMAPEAAIASHAVAQLGAVQVPIFSGFAAPAVAARLADAKAKVLITADGTLRRGQTVPMKESADEALRDAPTVAHVVVWRRLGRDDVPMVVGRDTFWDDLVEGREGAVAPVEVESEAPYLLAYTSGTTGKPKGALHVQGGFVVSIAREAAYQSDVRAGDRVLFATDMGWIMGPWTVVGAGALGAATIFVEGAPDWPHDRLCGSSRRNA